MKATLTLLLFFCLTAASAIDTKPLLFYNVNIINVENGSIRQNGAVVIEGNKIKIVGEFDKLKSGIPKQNRIDGKGKYLIPGLWDMHVHLEGAELIEDNKALLPVFLAYGITTVRDCASDLGEQVLAWRKEIETGKLIGPTIFTAGRKLEGKNSIWKGDLEIENETELNQMLDLLDTYHVDFVKITENTLSGDLFLKSVKAASARGYKVSGHVPYNLTIQELIEAGFTSIEHASYLMRLGSDEAKIKSDLLSGTLTRTDAEARYTNEFDQQLAIEKYTALGKKRLFVCPTLIGGRQLAYLNETDHSKDEFLNYLTKKFTDNYQWRIQRMANDTPEQRQQRKDKYAILCKQLPFIQQAGIRIIAGSDAAALNTYVYPAESLLEELEIFQEAGLTPLQILQSATLNGAEYFNIVDKTATIAAGKKADFVLLEQNPLENVQALRTVNSVVANGTYFNRDDLNSILKKARETKKELDAQRDR